MTNQLPDDISFERWVGYVFDHPVPKRVPNDVREAYHQALFKAARAGNQGGGAKLGFPPEPEWMEWYSRSDREHWNCEADPNRTVDYLTRLFSAIGRLTELYNDDQISQGIDFLINYGCMNSLQHRNVPLKAQIACVQSFYSLFVNLFAQRCLPVASHMLVAWDNNYKLLNNACYMWWDAIPLRYSLSGDQARLQLDQQVLDVMAKTLQIDHIACQEGALHGLGHWKPSNPEFVAETINRFLQDHPDPDHPLLYFARSALMGVV